MAVWFLAQFPLSIRFKHLVITGKIAEYFFISEINIVLKVIENSILWDNYLSLIEVNCFKLIKLNNFKLYYRLQFTCIVTSVTCTCICI